MENIQDRELSVSAIINAPVASVWDVWTKPEHIAKWWGPNGFTNTIDVMDLKPDGEWNFVMHGPDGTDFKNKSTFKEIVPMRKIVFDHFHPNFTATIEFEDQGDKTHLAWSMLFETVEVFNAVVKVHKADEGLKQNIIKLETYLQGLK
jgi:uncharacterized protein YndB with AHSA1/START domain